MSAPPPNDAPDFGRYRLISRLSVGGSAEVFKAKAFGERGGEEIVALKRLLPHAEARPELVAAFVAEGRLVAQLDHPSIAKVCELGQAQGSHYLTMEYVHGRDVGQLVRALEGLGRRADPALVAALGVQAAEALAYAHAFVDERGVALKIVHRDVSPQNLMVERSGAIKLVDFGIARFEGRGDHTATGVLKGKQGYMSPEQVRREPLDGRSDLFSLGVVLWELLAARRLFVGASPIERLALIEAAEVPPLRAIRPEVPAPLASWVTRCLARDPDDRPPSGVALARGLQRSLRALDAASPEAVVARAYEALFAEGSEPERAESLDEYRQALRAAELGEDPGLAGRAASDITIVPDTADLRAYLARLRGPLAATEGGAPERAPREDE